MAPPRVVLAWLLTSSHAVHPVDEQTSAAQSSEMQMNDSGTQVAKGLWDARAKDIEGVNAALAEK